MKKVTTKYRLRFARKRQTILAKLYKERKRRERGKKTWRSSHLAPAEFGLSSSNRKPLIAFIDEIRRSVIAGARLVLIDFSRTQKFIADGTLLFYAEIDRLLDHFPRLQVRCNFPYNEKASQVLEQIGFYRRIGKNTKFIACEGDDVVTWRTARGQGADGERYDDILGHYDGIITEALQDELYTGLTEAMTNAHHHAYILKRGDGIVSSRSYKPWWMFSQEKDGKLTVVFCDLGVGIPGSLPHNKDEGWQYWWSVMKRFKLHDQGDAGLIRGAVRHSRTRTKLHHRGKGLTQIIETVSAHPSGKAVIQSNKGWYRIDSGNETFDDHRTSIKGTIIFWQLPLKGRP